MRTPLLLAALGLAPVTEWESPLVIALKLLAVLFLVLLNGFFVASEFAIVKVRESQLSALGEDARFARHVVAHLDAYLSATQLGITLASLGLGWLGEPFLARMIEPFFALAGVTSPVVVRSVSFGLAFATITFLHIVLGELAPKSLAIRKSVGTTLWVTRPLGLFHALFKPAIWLLNGAANWLLRHLLGIDPVGESERAHSEEELRLLLAESGKARELSVRGAQISVNAFNLRRLMARDIMTPRPEVVFLKQGDSFASNLRRVKASRHTRFPLCREHLDQALGLVHVKDMIALQDEPEPELESIKRELLLVPELMPLEKLLDLFLSKHAHLVLAVDEYGGVAGMVTLENVIEEVVGEIQDEFDTEGPEYEALGEDEFSIRGSLGLHELRALTQLDLESAEVSTVGGYVTQRLGHLPQTGETLQIEDYLVTVTKAGPRRVRQLHFKKAAGPSPNESEDAARDAERGGPDNRL